MTTSRTSQRAEKRRLTGAQRRARILDAAVRLFAESGYAGASIDRIAEASGVSAPVIYDHFRSKQALFVAVMERARDELTSRGGAAMNAAGPLRSRLRSAVDAFFAFVQEEPAAARVLLVTHRGTPELQAAARSVQAEATARLVSLLAAEPNLLAGVPDRDRRLELFVEFIKHGMHGLAEWWAAHPEVSREDLVGPVTEMAWSGLRAASP
jgi:AcrR family transcriptional regulator